MRFSNGVYKNDFWRNFGGNRGNFSIAKPQYYYGQCVEDYLADSGDFDWDWVYL